MVVEQQVERGDRRQALAPIARPAPLFRSLIWFTLRVMALLAAIKLAYLFAAWVSQ